MSIGDDDITTTSGAQPDDVGAAVSPDVPDGSQGDAESDADGAADN